MDFNRVLDQIRDMGFAQKFVRDPLPPKALIEKRKMEKSGEVRLNVEFMWTPLFCLFLGWVLSAITFAFELRARGKKNSWADKITVVGQENEVFRN